MHEGYLGNDWEQGKKREQQLGTGRIKSSHTVSKREPWEACEQMEGKYDLERVVRKLTNP